MYINEVYYNVAVEDLAKEAEYFRILTANRWSLTTRRSEELQKDLITLELKHEHYKFSPVVIQQALDFILERELITDYKIAVEYHLLAYIFSYWQCNNALTHLAARAEHATVEENVSMYLYNGQPKHKLLPAQALTILEFGEDFVTVMAMTDKVLLNVLDFAPYMKTQVSNPTSDNCEDYLVTSNVLEDIFLLEATVEEVKSDDTVLTSVEEVVKSDDTVLKLVEEVKSDDSVASLELIEARLLEYSYGLLRYIEWENIVIAGGFLIYLLSKTEVPGVATTDIDLYIYGENRYQVLCKTIAAIRLATENEVLIFQCYHIVTLVIRNIPRNIQLILHDGTVEEILEQFDSNYVQVSYDGTSYSCYPAFLTSLVTKEAKFYRNEVKLARVIKAYYKGYTPQYMRENVLIKGSYDYTTTEVNVATTDSTVERMFAKYLYVTNESTVRVRQLFRALFSTNYELVTVPKYYNIGTNWLQYYEPYDTLQAVNELILRDHYINSSGCNLYRLVTKANKTVVVSLACCVMSNTMIIEDTNVLEIDLILTTEQLQKLQVLEAEYKLLTEGFKVDGSLAVNNLKVKGTIRKGKLGFRCYFEGNRILTAESLSAINHTDYYEVSVLLKIVIVRYQSAFWSKRLVRLVIGRKITDPTIAVY